MNLPPFSKKKIILGILTWWITLELIEAYTLVSTFGFSVKVALVDALNFNVLIALAWFVIFNGLRYYNPGLSRGFFLGIWSLVLAALCELLHTYLMKSFFSGEAAYLNYLSESHLIRGLVIWLMILLVAALSWIWYYLQDQRETELREQDAQRLAREAELATLRQQLQPHFLFNSLNSISALASTQPEEARKMIQQLSDFLRGTVKRDDQQLVVLEDELSHLQLYLDIEKVRFGNRLKTEIKKDEQSLLMKLPSLLLQPIVENAIKFGLYDTTGEILIRIMASTENNNLILTISNPFDPFTSKPRQGTGFGLTAVQRRLYLLYARNDLLTTRQENEENSLFVTQVKIPQAV